MLETKIGAAIIETFKVEIKNIKVGKRYWSFDFKTWRNKELVAKGSLDGSHSRSGTFMRKHLKNGGAVEHVLEGQHY